MTIPAVLFWLLELGTLNVLCIQKYNRQGLGEMECQRKEIKLNILQMNNIITLNDGGKTKSVTPETQWTT